MIGKLIIAPMLMIGMVLQLDIYGEPADLRCRHG
jgi:hypothetical protein